MVYVPDSVRSDLLYLRKGPGYTARRIQRCTALRATLGGLDEPEHLLRERLVSAIKSLSNPQADLLLAVYAIDEAFVQYPALASRREVLADRLGVGRDAVADRDAAAIEQLLIQLITGWYPKSPLPIRVPESHNAIVQHSVTITTVVRDHKHLETNHNYCFFATFDGAEYVAIATPAGAITVTNGDITLQTRPIESGYLHQFWLPHPMRRGQTYEIQFRILGEPDDPYWLTEESLAFHEPTRHASFETVFMGARPTTIWSFTGLTYLERPGASNETTTLDFGGGTSVKAEFTDLHGGLYNGVAWDW